MKTLFTSISLLFFVAVFGQTAANDISFNKIDSISLKNFDLRSFHELPDGKMIFGGLVRSFSDGRVDTSFNTGIGVTGLFGVYSTSLQTDGKIIICGDFTAFNGINRNRVVRLNSNGSLDNSFNVGSGANNDIYTSALQGDGKVLLGGRFTAINNVNANRLVRLNADGSKDVNFLIGSGASDSISCISVQSDGKILVAGNFTNFSGVTKNFIVRLNNNGSIDNGFDCGTLIPSYVKSMVVQPDGKILVSGQYYLKRLMQNGSLDASFLNVTTAGCGGNINKIVLFSDGRIMIGGSFCNYGNTATNGTVRLFSNGSVDNSFQVMKHYFFWVGPGLAVQNNGKILIQGGGYHPDYNLSFGTRLFRANDNGTIDRTFNNTNGADDLVSSIKFQPNGKIIISGGFTSYNNVEYNRIARIKTDGSLDSSFTSNPGANSLITATAIQPDGKIVIGGTFTTYNGIPRKSIARLNVDGSLDNSFQVGQGFTGVYTVYDLSLQSDGKILVCGGFSAYNGTTIHSIARINTNGTLDNTFTSYMSSSSPLISKILQLPDGKIIVLGSFNYYQNSYQHGIVRLNSDGSNDTSFASPFVNLPTIGGSIGRCMSLQNDGKVIVGGKIRLNTNGTIDSSFVSSFSGSLLTTAIQPDGKILIGGDPGQQLYGKHILRLNYNGSFDTTFKTPIGPNSDVNSIALQPDGRIIFSGNFSSYNNVVRNRIAQIFPSCYSPTIQASNILFTNVSTNTISLKWSNGNGARRIVKINTINNFSNNLNSTNPTANNIYGGANEQVIYNGTLDNMTVSNLLPGLNYCFKVYEANCTGVTSMYDTSTNLNLACIATTLPCLTPQIQAKNLSVSPILNGKSTLNWTNGDGQRRIVKLSKTNSFANLVDGNEYTASNTYNNIAEQVVYNGVSNSIQILGLDSLTNYCYKVYELNCINNQTKYNNLVIVNNAICQTNTTLTSNSNIDIATYPNPAKTNITVDNLSLTDKWQTCNIYASDGKLIYTTDKIVNKTKVLLDVASLASGNYLILLVNAAGEKKIIKFLKN